MVKARGKETVSSAHGHCIHELSGSSCCLYKLAQDQASQQSTMHGGGAYEAPAHLMSAGREREKEGKREEGYGL